MRRCFARIQIPVRRFAGFGLSLPALGGDCDPHSPLWFVKVDLGLALHPDSELSDGERDRAAVQSDVLWWDALEGNWPISWWPHRGRHRFTWQIQCVLHGSQQWWRVEKHRLWKNMDAYF